MQGLEYSNANDDTARIIMLFVVIITAFIINITFMAMYHVVVV